MNVRKFIVVNVRDVLRKVKEMFGNDVIIFFNCGIFGGVEIMVVVVCDMVMIVLI